MYLHKNITYMLLLQLPTCDRVPETPKPSIPATHYNYKATILYRK